MSFSWHSIQTPVLLYNIEYNSLTGPIHLYRKSISQIVSNNPIKKVSKNKVLNRIVRSRQSGNNRKRIRNKIDINTSRETSLTKSNSNVETKHPSHDTKEDAHHGSQNATIPCGTLPIEPECIIYAEMSKQTQR